MAKSKNSLEKARSLYHKEEYSDAFQALDKIINREPTDVVAWIYRGRALHKLKRYTEAIQSYDKAIKLNPKDAFPWALKGDSLRDIGRYEDALESYEKAIQIEADNHLHWIGKGIILESMERFTEALQSYDRAIELSPKEAFAWMCRAGSLRSLERYEEALESYDRAAELDPTRVDIWSDKGWLYIGIGDFKKAIEQFDKACELDPTNGFLRFVQARVFSDLGDLPNALVEVDKAIKLLRDKGDADWEKRAKSWKYSLSQIIKEKAEKKEPQIEEQIIREVRQLFQVGPKSDPFTLIKENQEKVERYFMQPRTINITDNYLHVLRRWNSFTPKIPNREQAKRGGGYFLVWKGKGIVIDPGFDFLDNFDIAGYSIQDVDAIVLTHAHTDHTADFESLLCLKYEQANQLKDNSKVDLFLNLGTMQKFVGWVSGLSGIGKVVSINAGDSLEPAGYQLVLRAMDAIHSEVIGKERCCGLVLDLREGTKTVLNLGITSDTGWSPKIQRQYKGCKLLFIHLGGIGENEFDEELPLRGKKRLYPEHLGLIGTISMVKAIKSSLSIITEFGEELGNARGHIAKTIDSFFNSNRRCITGDIGLKIRLPDLSVNCDICGEYSDYSTIETVSRKKTEEIKYCCQLHERQDVIDWIDRMDM